MSDSTGMTPARPVLHLVKGPPPGTREVAAALAAAGVRHPGWSYEDSAAAVLTALAQLDAAGWPEPGQPVEYQFGEGGVPRRGTFAGLDAGTEFTARVVPEGVTSSYQVPLSQVRPASRRSGLGPG